MTAGEFHAAVRLLVAEHDACRRILESTSDALHFDVSGAMDNARSALEKAWSLLEFLETGLETHISREEGPLFPRLKAALPADDRLVDEMVAEHDLIRIKRGDVRTALTHLLGAHDDLRLDRAALRTALAATVSPQASLVTTQRAVDVVAAKLRVHFENEEELVFPIAPEILSPGELDRIAVEMVAFGGMATV